MYLGKDVLQRTKMVVFTACVIGAIRYQNISSFVWHEQFIQIELVASIFRLTILVRNLPHFKEHFNIGEFLGS